MEYLSLLPPPDTFSSTSLVFCRTALLKCALVRLFTLLRVWEVFCQQVFGSALKKAPF